MDVNLKNKKPNSKCENSKNFLMKEKTGFETKKNNIINENLDIDKLTEEKDKKLKELQEKYEKEHEERYQIELKLMNLKNNFEKEKIDNQFKRKKNFLEKCEVIEKWEKFALNDITENFVDFSPIEIFHLISNLFYLCKELLNNILMEKYNQLLNCFNVPSNSKSLESIQLRLKPFILDNMSDIIFNEKESLNFLELLKKDFKNISINIIKNKESEFNDLINDKSFKTMIKSIKNLILFAMFNEPILNFNIEKNYKCRKIEKVKINKNNKDNYIIINEPGINNFEAIIILNPPVTKSGNEIAELNDLKKIIIKNEESNNCYQNDNKNINNILNINEYDNKNIIKNSTIFSGEISIKKKFLYDQLERPILSQFERMRLEYRNKTFQKNIDNTNQDSYSINNSNQLSHRMNKSLNHNVINRKQYIDGLSKDYDYIHTDLNDENNNNDLIYEHNSYQIKGKKDCEKTNNVKRNLKKMSLNENDYKQVLKNAFSNDFFLNNNVNNNNNINNMNNSIFQIFQKRNKTQKHLNSNKKGKICHKKFITKKPLNKKNINKNKSNNNSPLKKEKSNEKNNITNQKYMKSNINQINKKSNKENKKEDENTLKNKNKDFNNYDGIFSSPGKENNLIKNIERPSTGTTKSSTYFNIDTDSSIPKKDIRTQNFNIISLNQTNRVISQVGFYKQLNSPKFFYVNQLDNNINNLIEKNEISNFHQRFIVKVNKNSSKKIIMNKENNFYNKNDKNICLINTIRNSSLLKLKKNVKNENKRTKSPNIFIQRGNFNYTLHQSKRSFQ